MGSELHSQRKAAQCQLSVNLSQVVSTIIQLAVSCVKKSPFKRPFIENGFLVVVGSDLGCKLTTSLWACSVQLLVVLYPFQDLIRTVS